MSDDDKEPINFYAEHMDNAIRHLTNMTHIKSFDNAAAVQDLEKLKGFLPVGKDLVLADFSTDIDRALYTEYHQLLTNLITLQMGYKQKNTKGQVEIGEGILPGIQTVFYYFMYFVTGTRATGRQRERMVQADPKHSINQNIGNKLFGSSNGA